MKTAELRKAFLEYFKTNQHTIVKSSSLVPHDDPTLLFTTAGMVETAQKVHQGGLSGPGSPEYGMRFAGTDTEIDALQVMDAYK